MSVHILADIDPLFVRWWQEAHGTEDPPEVDEDVLAAAFASWNASRGDERARSAAMVRRLEGIALRNLVGLDRPDNPQRAVDLNHWQAVLSMVRTLLDDVERPIPSERESVTRDDSAEPHVIG